jgi:hypothetical protein
MRRLSKLGAVAVIVCAGTVLTACGAGSSTGSAKRDAAADLGTQTETGSSEVRSDAGNGGGGAAGTADIDGGLDGSAGSPTPDTVESHIFKCGSLTCDNRTQVCCRKFGDTKAPDGGEPDLDFHCAAVGTCGSPDNIQQSCNSGANCPTGQVCALPMPTGVTFETYSCTDPVSAAVYPVGILCRDQAECPADTTCTPGPSCFDAMMPCTPNPLSYLSSCQPP